MKKFYHPITHEITSIEELIDNCDESSLFIDAYNYKPLTWNSFYVEGEDKQKARTYGIEIELNQSRDLSERLDILIELYQYFNKKAPHIHIMYDGSLRNGFEIVMSPMTYRYFMENFDADEINDLFRRNNLYASYDCGLHIHAGYLHSTEETRGRVNDLLHLFNVTLPLWTSIGNRTIGYQGNRYSSFNFFKGTNSDSLKYLRTATSSLIEKGYSKVDLQLKDIIFKYNEENRYQALNLSGRTMEFRLFKGTHNWNVIQEYLTFVNKFMTVFSEGKTITNIDDFVEITGSQKHLKNVVRDMRRFRYLYEKGLIGRTPEDNLEMIIYKRPTNHIAVGNFMMEKSLWERYVRNIEHFNKAIKCDNYFNNSHYEKIDLNFETYLSQCLVEVVSVGETEIKFVPANTNNKNVVTIKRDNLDGYVILYGVPRDIIDFSTPDNDKIYLSK